MADLDWSVDSSRMLDLIRGFPAQCEEAVEIGQGVGARDLSGTAAILVAGMGGSAIGGDLLRLYLSDELKTPILVNRDYTLPQWVGEKTLIFLSSYSGNTEETLSTYYEGKSRGAELISITSGGKLGELTQEDGHLLVKVPGGMAPRCALGYLFFPMLGVLTCGGIVETKDGEVGETLKVLRQMAEELSKSQNKALELARKLVGKLPVIYSSSSFEVVVRRWATQLNENSKTFAHTNLLPELNHNEIVGWEQPEALLRDAEVFFLRDPKEHSRVQRRMEITKEMLSPIASGISEIWAKGEGLLSRLFSLIYFGDYLSYYLALLLGVDPTPVNRINHLKEKLR